MRRGSSRRDARREWARRETPDLVKGIRQRLVTALADAQPDAEAAVRAVVQEVQLELLRRTGDLDLALHGGARTRQICLETLRALQSR
jgi:hypothetical protein